MARTTFGFMCGQTRRCVIICVPPKSVNHTHSALVLMIIIELGDSQNCNKGAILFHLAFMHVASRAYATHNMLRLILDKTAFTTFRVQHVNSLREW